MKRLNSKVLKIQIMQTFESQGTDISQYRYRYWNIDHSTNH